MSTDARADPAVTPKPSSEPWYVPTADLFDETRSADGTVRPHWEYLSRALQGLGAAELRRRRDEASRLLRENGVNYHSATEGGEGRHA